ncbi:hypothetical protein PO548_26055, partial [Klebsiella pneumoniae]
KHAYCLKTQPATGETYPKSDLFNKAAFLYKSTRFLVGNLIISSILLGAHRYLLLHSTDGRFYRFELATNKFGSARTGLIARSYSWMRT